MGQITHLLCSGDDEKGTSKYVEAQKRGIPIVTEDFILQILSKSEKEVDASASVEVDAGSANASTSRPCSPPSVSISCTKSCQIEN